MPSDDGTDGMEPSFQRRLREFMAASEGRITVYSGYRSVEDQTYLWNNALAKYGSEDAARQWVAPPGKSNHNKGWAADLAYATADAKDWAHANAARFGLVFPMSWEPWHIEPAEARGEAPPEAYTIPDEPGVREVHDPANYFDMGYQLQSFLGILQRMGREDPVTRPDPVAAMGREDPAASPGRIDPVSQDVVDLAPAQPETEEEVA